MQGRPNPTLPHSSEAYQLPRVTWQLAGEGKEADKSAIGAFQERTSFQESSSCQPAWSHQKGPCPSPPVPLNLSALFVNRLDTCTPFHSSLVVKSAMCNTNSRQEVIDVGQRVFQEISSQGDRRRGNELVKTIDRHKPCSILLSSIRASHDFTRFWAHRQNPEGAC